MLCSLRRLHEAAAGLVAVIRGVGGVGGVTSKVAAALRVGVHIGS